jgi:outer membrane protein TolC
MVLLMTLALALPARAAATGTAVLTLADAITAAGTDAYAVRLAVNQVDSARSREQETFAGLLPRLGLNGTYGQQFPSSTANPLAPVQAGEINQLAGGTSVTSLQTGLQITQLLYDGGRVFDGWRMASLQAELAASAARQARADASVACVGAYFSALRARAATTVARQAVTFNQELKRQAEQFVAAGIGIMVDVHRAESQLQQAEQDLDAAEVAVRQADMELNTALGRDVSLPVALDAAAQVTPLPLSASDAVATALSQRFDLQQLRQRLQADELAWAIQTRNYWPSLSLYSNLQAHDSAVIAAQFFNQQNASVGASLSWPLFDGFEGAARARQAELTVRQDRLSIAQSELLVAKEVRQAHLDVALAERRIQRLTDAAAAAGKALDLARWRYREHVGTSWELREAQLGWQQARLALVQAQADLQTQRARLYRALGRERPDVQSAPPP